MRYDNNKILILKQLNAENSKQKVARFRINLMILKVSECQWDRSDERNTGPAPDDQIWVQSDG